MALQKRRRAAPPPYASGLRKRCARPDADSVEAEMQECVCVGQDAAMLFTGKQKMPIILQNMMQPI
eukprot:6192870-Pleurochrysis_carterae.AAC.4